MYRLSLYLFLLPYILLQHGYELSAPRDITAAPDTSTADSCRKVVEYVYSHKVMEGMVCNDKREGIWREWDINGKLKDSAMYIAGVRQYMAMAAKKVRGTLSFRGDPKQFFKDSTYECSVRVNIYHGIHDVRGDYDGMPDTSYPPLFYFGADMGARDSFNYYFTPKSSGRFKLKLSLTGDAATASGNTAFYEKDIEVLRK